MSPSCHLAFTLTLCSVTYALPVLQARSTQYSKPSFDTSSAIALAIFLSLSALVALGYAAIVHIRKRRLAPTPTPAFSTKKATIKVTKEQISKPFAPVDLVSSIIPEKDGGPGFGFEGLSESVLQSLREQESWEDTNERSGSGGEEDDASVKFVKLPDTPPMLSMGSLKSNSSFRIVLHQEKDTD